MADLLSFKPEGILPLRLIHPLTEKYIGVTVNLKSLDSPEVKKLEAKHREEILRSGKGLKGVTAAKLDRHSEETLVAAIDSWTFELDEDGEQATLGGEESPKCDERNKLKLIRSVFGKQIDSALEDETAFFTES